MSLTLPAGVALPVTASALVLTQQPGNGDNGGQGEDFGKSSPVGFLVLILFLIAVAFLVRSMTKHLKRVPASFDEPPAAEEQQASADAPPAEAEAETPAPAEPAKKPANGTSSAKSD
jgi:Na+-transporting methylmalonyl-CoA/oxaloacetate decarboxylase gamma subunit